MTVPGLLASRPGYHESRAHKAALACCRSTRRRGQDRGGFAFLAASPHGAHTLRSHQGLGSQAEAVRPHTPPGPRRHSPDRKWSEARDWARSALFRSLSSFSEPSQAKPARALSSGRSQRQKGSCQATSPDAQQPYVREAGPGPGQVHGERQ